MKIQLHGAIETNNYGDILLVKLFYDYMHLKYPNADFIIKRACNDLYAELGPTIKKRGKPNLVIFGGGGYLCDGNLKFTLHMIKTIYIHMFICRLKKIPYYIVGAGTKTYNNGFFKKFIKFCLNGANEIIVRNNESKLDLYELGVKKNVIVTADNVMAIDRNYIKYDRVSKEITSYVTNNTRVLIHINYFLLDGNQKINEGIKVLYSSLKSYFNQKNNYDFIITCDHNTDEFINQVNDIVNLFPSANAKFIVCKNIYDVMALIDKSDYVITTKLHVGITAVAFGKRVASFAIHPKTMRFYSQIGQNKRCILLQDCLNEKIIKETLDYSFETDYDESIINGIRNKAKSNYELLNKYIEEYHE